MKKIFSIFFISGAFFVATIANAQLPDFTSLVVSEGPAVVNINTTQTIRERQADPFFEFFGNNPFFDGGQSRSPRSPQIREYQARSLGSGFIISADGYVMTNAHVVAKANQITVTLTDKREFQAKLIGADARTDIALLKIEASDLPVVRLGNPASLKVGEWVIAIGSPFGFENSVSAGIISAKERQLPREDFVPFIQTDVAVNPGNSGGPLFDLKGEVVGINSQIYSQSGGFQGISFAIPIDIATKVAEELKTSGHVSRGRLGVYLQEMSKELGQSFGVPDGNGALIAQVEKGSAADKAGMQSGDIVLKINDEAIRRSSDLPRIIGNTRPGVKVDIQIWRAQKVRNVTATVDEIKEEAVPVRNTQNTEQGKPSDTNKVGILFQNLDARDMNALKNMGFNFGVVVLNPGSAARDGVIRRGDVVVGIGGTPLKNGQQLIDAINNAPKDSKLAFQIIRQGTIMFVPVPMTGK